MFHAWRRVAAPLAASCTIFAAGLGLAAPTFTQNGDGTFRNITATGGAIRGVDVSAALVQANGSSTTLAALALQAANAVPLVLGGQPNGWLKLDSNGLAPASELPAGITGVDGVARAAATSAQTAAVTAQTLAAAAVPFSAANKANGFPQLDGNALVPVSVLPASITSPTDAIARAAASAAQTLAAAAVPSSAANKAGGFPQLDSNALVPIASLPAVYTSSTALATSTLGQANGPAQLDSTGSLSANKVATASSAVQRTLAQHFSDALNGADYGMVCDGSTDDTVALRKTISMALARPSGVEIILPAGQCEIGGEIDIAASSSLRVEGYGIGTTHLEFTTNNDGLVFTLSNEANLTVDDMTISKRAGTNPPGIVFAHRALIAHAALVNNGQASHTQAGQVIFARLNVYGASPIAQTDGWAVGIGVIDINFPDIVDNVVSQPGGPITAALSSPSSLQSYPTAFAPGVASDFLLQGLPEPSGFQNAGAQDYTLDATMIGNAATGGIAALDLDGTQGGYIAANRFFANTYGIRSDSKATTVENITVVANFIQDWGDDIYLNGLQGAEIGSNMFWQFNSASGDPTFVGVWLRNGSSNTVTGNSFELNGTSNPSGEDAIYFTSDATAGGFANFPSTVTGNNIFNVHGVGIGNDATISGLTVTGNSLNLAVSTDPGLQDLSMTSANSRGNNQYIVNGSPYPDLKSDTNGSIVVRRSLTCGGPYDQCLLTVLNNGATTFSTDASGNTTVQNMLTAGAMKTPTISSSVVSVGGSGHQTIQEDLWAYASGTVTLTTNGAVENASNSLPGVPNASSGGTLSVSGRMLCAGASGAEVFRFSGIWAANTSGVLSLYSFTSSEDDGQTTPPSGWGMKGAVDTANNLPLIQATGLSTTSDCTAQAAEIINQ